MSEYKRGKYPGVNAACPPFISKDQYIAAKVKILKRDFCVQLIEEDIKFLYQFDTQAAIDTACRHIIFEHWDHEEVLKKK